MPLQLVPPPDAAPYRGQGAAMIDEAKAVQITDDDSYQDAAAKLRRVAMLQRSIRDGFAESKESAYKTHKSITQLEASLLAFPAEAERIIKGKISAYTVEQERQRRIREAEEQAAARKRADEAAIEEAQRLAAAGDVAGAEQVIEEAAGAPAPVIELPKLAAPGVTTRKSFTWRLTDKSAVKPEFLIVDEAKVGKLVRALGPDAAAVVGGIEVIEERVVSVRSA